MRMLRWPSSIWICFSSQRRFSGARFDRGWAANTRLSINVQNMFDRFQRVTLADGTVPAGYDRYQLNPLGRTVQVTFRKHL